jgi:2-polyprenyl-3-methyl-5-hydroxy-6-metoxy-1,4-benzoquinol methylase
MKNRDERTAGEINSHMAIVKNSALCGAVFAQEEYSCFICNVYFRRKIFQSDLPVIEDIIKFQKSSANFGNVLALENFLQATNKLTKNLDQTRLDHDFRQSVSDDLKNKLRSLYKTKPTKDSRVHNIEGEYFDDFYAKYARDLDANWIRNIQRFTELKLKKPSRILDIGPGFGLFSHIARFNGHTVESIDMPNASPILKEATKILKIKVHEFTVTKNTPLLKFKKKFDIVHASQIFFNNHATPDLWDVDEWKYFLLDLHDNVLNDGGFVHLLFNGEHRKLKPIMVDGEQVFLGKKSLEEFFKPFFVMIHGMARLENKMLATLTKKNINDICNTNIFKKRSYTLEA